MAADEAERARLAAESLSQEAQARESRFACIPSWATTVLQYTAATPAEVLPSRLMLCCNFVTVAMVHHFGICALAISHLCSSRYRQVSIAFAKSPKFVY